MRSKLKKIAIGLFVLLVLICAGVPTLLWSMGGGKPNIAVDYEEKLNERAAAVPEGDRAWPIYKEAFVELARLDIADEGTFKELLGEVEDSGDARWQAAVEGVSQRDGVIETLRTAASKPGLGFETTHEAIADFERAIAKATAAGPARLAEIEAQYNAGQSNTPTWLVDMLLPHLGHMRNASKLLVLDARIAIEETDPERFIADMSALHSIADHVEEHPILISQLVALAIRALATDTVSSAVVEHPDLFELDQLQRLQNDLEQMNRGEPLATDLTGERFVMYDTIQRVFTDDGEGNGRLTAEGSELLLDLADTGVSAGRSAGSRITVGAANLVASDRRTVTQIYDQMLLDADKLMAVPLWEREVTVDEIWQPIFDEAITFPPDLGIAVLGVLMPALDRAMLSPGRVEMSRDAAIAAVASARWRLVNGAWPDELGSLVPDLLDQLPIDQFDGVALKYSLAEEGPVIYSVGSDRDDDGGRHVDEAHDWVPPGRIAEWLASKPGARDGDWVFVSPAAESSDSD